MIYDATFIDGFCRCGFFQVKTCHIGPDSGAWDVLGACGKQQSLGSVNGENVANSSTHFLGAAALHEKSAWIDWVDRSVDQWCTHKDAPRDGWFTQIGRASRTAAIRGRPAQGS